MKTPRTTVRQIDVARKARVSQATVSYVLSGKSDGTRQVSRQTILRTKKAAAELGYRPNIAARQLQGKRSHLLGVLLGLGAPPVMFHRVAAIEHEAKRLGYRVLVGQVHGLDSVTAYVDDFIGRGVDGVVCLSHEYPGRREAAAEIVSQIDHVVFLRRPAVEGAPFVNIDAADGIHQAMDHLVATGRRRIAIQLVNDTQVAHVDRQAAYRSAVGRHGLEVDDSLMWIGGERLLPDPQGPSREFAEEVVAQLLDRAQAHAIIAINDDWAALLIKALRRRGARIPDDVAVVGQGNFQSAVLVDPELTTLDPQNDAFGAAAVGLLVEMLEGEAATQPDPIKPRLIVREST